MIVIGFPEYALPLAPWDGSVFLQVRFPDLVDDCVESVSFEYIKVNTLTDTVQQVKNAIATRLHIEADEFVFYHKRYEHEYTSEADTPFATKYMTGDYITRFKDGLEKNAYQIYMYKSKFYKGKTGKLKWLLEQKEFIYCGNDHDNGQLAKRFEKLLKKYEAQHNIKSKM